MNIDELVEKYKKQLIQIEIELTLAKSHLDIADAIMKGVFDDNDN